MLVRTKDGQIKDVNAYYGERLIAGGVCEIYYQKEKTEAPAKKEVKNKPTKKVKR
jgi:hypothetical protein